MILEFDLIKHTSSFLKDAFKAVEIQNELRLGCDRIIRISEVREVTLFEIPMRLEETEEFSSWLQLSSYLDLSYDGDRLFASMKQISLTDIDLDVFKGFLLNLHKKTSSKKLHMIIDKWLKNMEYEDHIKVFFKTVKALFVQFVELVNRSSLVQCKYSRELEFEITPIAFYMFKLINDHAIFSLLEKPRDLPKNNLQNFKRVLDLWDIHKETQSKLFEEANHQLSTLIKNNLRFKPFLQRYTQDLTGPAKGILGKMRPYPKEFRIDQSERGDNLTDKALTISSKAPKIKPAFQKNKTKKISHKKTSQSEQIAVQSKKILEIKEGLKLSLAKEKTIKTELGCGSSGKDELKLSQPTQMLLPGDSFSFKFDQRVQRWNDHAFGQPFLKNEFPEYHDKALSYQKLMHLFHAPHHLVDRFLSFGIEGTWLNVKNSKNDLRYVIPAEITYENKTHRGLIVYAIDSETNVCYHRFFTEKKDQDILYQITNKVFNENDYPDLRDAVNVGQFPLPKLNVVDSSSIKIQSGHVEIIDFEREVKIKLFKVKNFK
ncbi:MAG: hypothetical protein H0T62_13600 [Parachlamydiaceae bacterium]|nr:hypothetical protein [Parachlamydiaceae bacterium]